MNKIYDGIMGLVVGDALGIPVEFKKRDTYKITDMTGYGTYNQPPGTWSDDSSMTLATLESIGRLGKIDCDDIMRNFCKWFEYGEFTPYGTVFDIGGATQRAIQRFRSGTKPSECGGKDIMDNDNGALMRILPIVFVPHTPFDIMNVAALTHNHVISNLGCGIYVAIAEMLLSGKNKIEVMQMIQEFIDLLSPEYSRLPNIQALKRSEIKSSGYVVDTLEAALWCFLTTNTYSECVLTAVNLGEDTDTVAAVAGGLAGLLYGCGGESGIPDKWIEQIPKRDWIKALCGGLIF